MKKLLKGLMIGLLSAALIGCGTKENVIRPDDSGYAEGNMGDTLATEWFTIKVNSASLTDNYMDAVEAREGEKLAVVNVTLASTYDKDVPMFDTDFQIQWGEADDGFGYPVTSDDSSIKAEGMLESEYTLGAKKKVTGDLVFRVPDGWNDFWLAFQEYYDTSDEEAIDGNTFFIAFQAK